MPYDDVRLRAVEDGDLEVFFDAQRDPESVRLTALPAKAQDAFLTYWVEIRAGGAVLARTIVVDGEVAGNVMGWQQWGQRRIGYGLGRRYWGRGLATTALGLFLCVVDERPLHAYIAVHNAPSIRVVEKSGFRRVAVHHDGLAEFVLDGLA